MMKKRRFTLLTSLTALLMVCLLAAAFLTLFLTEAGRGRELAAAAVVPQGATIVRVAIALGQTGTTLTVQEGSYSLGDPDRGTEAGTAAAGQSLSISPAGSGLAVSQDGAVVDITGSRFLATPQGEGRTLINCGSRTYRGSFLVENKGGVLNVINVLDVDLYLLGVLPLEMGMSSTPAEALKAQAVVSRTYALRKKSATNSYDLVSGSIDQMYGGYGSEKAYTTAAVEATRGQAIFYDGQLIAAFFSANTGGYTEDAENVWNEALPYAKATPSPYDAYALETAQDSTGYPGYTYQWQVRYTIAELESRIAKWNQDNPSSPINIGGLRQLGGYALAYDPSTRAITNRQNASGRITRLDLIGGANTYSLYRESVRTFLGLRSTLFTITPEGGTAVRNGVGVTVMLGQNIRESKAVAAYGKASEINPGSDSFYIVTAEGVKKINKDESGTVTGYVFDGKGYGHGVGMSQWGAIGMARAGSTYGQILEHYYNQGKNDGRLTVRIVQ
jgi:stage II sporulation protein D